MKKTVVLAIALTAASLSAGGVDVQASRAVPENASPGVNAMSTTPMTNATTYGNTNVGTNTYGHTDAYGNNTTYGNAGVNRHTYPRTAYGSSTMFGDPGTYKNNSSYANSSTNMSSGRYNAYSAPGSVMRDVNGIYSTNSYRTNSTTTTNSSSSGWGWLGLLGLLGFAGLRSRNSDRDREYSK